MTAAVFVFADAQAARGRSPAFPGIVAALAWWSQPDRDLALLRAMVTPPCDALGDPIHDAALALVFWRLVKAGSLVERVGQITSFVDLNTDQARQWCEWAQAEIGRAKARGDALLSHAVDRAIESAQRTIAMMAVLRRWSSALVDDATERAAVQA